VDDHPIAKEIGTSVTPSPGLTLLPDGSDSDANQSKSGKFERVAVGGIFGGLGLHPLNGAYHGPGTPLSPEPEERDHFVRFGFLVSEPPSLEPSATEVAAKNPAGIGLQTKHQKIQGPSYR
jgi:hypothetical protein